MPLLLCCLVPVLLAIPSPRPTLAYTVTFDSAALDIVHVALRIENAPPSFRLAMKVHPEYDAMYWRYLDSLHVDGSGRVTRTDSTLWNVSVSGGRAVLRYRIRVQPQSGTLRDSWRPFVDRTGALINPPDFFLYLPDFPEAPATVELRAPADWRIATSLARTSEGARGTFAAPDAATLLDSPILLGHFREWSFADAGTTFHVIYWPLANGTPFDTTAFVDGIRRLAHETMAMFGRAPSATFSFYIVDGAQDALEHRASVTVGIPSVQLARDPHAFITEIAHEFFHSWNLVAIHPDRYGELSYRKTTPTTGLWWGEGVTLYYANTLTRRAGVADTGQSRLDRLRSLLRSSYASWWSGRVSPEQASLAFGASLIENPNASGSYYTQGELLGTELDALIRDSTNDTRTLDDVMRAMFTRSVPGRGYTSAELEAVVDSVCGCRLDAVFANQIRGHAPIDVNPALRRVGLQAVVDTIEAVNEQGVPSADLRISIDFSREGPPLRIVIANAASAWLRAGLRTGDELISIDGAPVASFAELRRILSGLRVGQRVTVNVRRNGRPIALTAPVTGYSVPRVRFVDVDSVTATQRARRERWLAGW